MKITVVGNGYVGLVTAVGLAELGHDVVCLSRDERKVRRLNRGQPTIYEVGLAAMLRRNIRAGRICFTTDRTFAYGHGPIVVIAVGTPPKRTGAADLSSVWSVGRDIARAMRRRTLVVTKSTVPVGTGAKLAALIERELRRRKRRLAFAVASNPEFLKEGAAIREFLHPDRVVIGVDKPWAASLLRRIYRPVTDARRPIVETDVRSAELIKYSANAFLATKISFMNEVARFADAVGADVTEVARGIGLDARIAPAFLRVGIGYGGSCFPKDVAALVAAGNDAGYHFKILRAVQDVNARQRRVVLEKLRRLLPKLRGRTAAVWGLSFKPQTDDVRSSAALAVVRDLLEAGARVRAYDPVARTEAQRVLPPSRRLRYVASALAAVRRADALLILTEWDEFKRADLQRVRRLLGRPILIDGRNVFPPEQLRQLGFRTASIGRP